MKRAAKRFIRVVPARLLKSEKRLKHKKIQSIIKRFIDNYRIKFYSAHERKIILHNTKRNINSLLNIF